MVVVDTVLDLVALYNRPFASWQLALWVGPLGAVAPHPLLPVYMDYDWAFEVCVVYLQWVCLVNGA